MKLFSSSIPKELQAALVVVAGFAAFLTWDQWHWWSVKEDYAFGYIVPLFVACVVYDRWPRMLKLLSNPPAVQAPRWLRRIGSVKAAAGLLLGLALFAMGALYRASSGVSQPGSLAMALGFAAVALCLIYLSVPPEDATPGVPVTRGFSAGIRVSFLETRTQVALLFVFPAFVWIVSAPLVSAVEHNLSLFLLNKVTGIVFFIFDMLGLPLERRGNVLAFPKGEVGVAEACSGIRSLTGSIFAGSFLAAVFLDRWWKKIGLVTAAMLLAFITNILRSLFLTAWACTHGSAAIEGSVHDVTGYAVLGLTTVGLLLLIPVFNFRFKIPEIDSPDAENACG
ncbi:MAG: exosortase/archaeosortase family protein [Opitutaceae bacterium]